MFKQIITNRLCCTLLLASALQVNARMPSIHGRKVPAKALRFVTTSQKITPDILKQMVYTWNPESPVPLEDLRHLTVTFYDFEGKIQQGELVVHEKAVEDLQWIFRKLFDEKFPIHSMRFVDEFGGSDDASMSANNSSAFYARKVARTNRWSNHATGLAVDINPLQNPYSKGDFFCPKEGEKYLNRSLGLPGMITKDTTIYKLFKERGWEWGGECFFERDGTIDRHHFQKVIEGINKTTNT